jgi:hypothetical protein
VGRDDTARLGPTEKAAKGGECGVNLQLSDDTRRSLLKDAIHTQRQAEVILAELPSDPNAIRHCSEMVRAMFPRKKAS